MSLIDSHGRQIRKIRVSLTDKCNLRCQYCMPVDSQFMPESHYLSVPEIQMILSELKELGLREVRLTGGEPLMRKNFSEICDVIGSLGFAKVGLTTNAILLDRHLDTLKQNKIESINVSLDSLNPEHFAQITHGNQLHKVLHNIRLAVAAGFHVKINTVAIRGFIENEIFDFIEFSKNENVEVRFLELMRIGYAVEKQNQDYISAHELIQKIESRYPMQKLQSAKDSTSFNFLVDQNARIGVIASESQPFCGHCSRWRLSANGILRACLLKDDGISVKSTTPEERLMIFQKLLGMKPYLRPKEVHHAMNEIGG